MGELYINGTVPTAAYVNETRVKNVFLNNTLVKTFTWGSMLVQFEWGYETWKHGSGCDNDLYFYPLTPKVYVSVSDKSVVDKVVIRYVNSGDFSSDCIRPPSTQTDVSVALDTWTNIPIRGLHWSDGSSASDYCYLNPDCMVYIYDKNNNVIGSVYFNTYLHMKYRDSAHSDVYETVAILQEYY